MQDLWESWTGVSAWIRVLIVFCGLLIVLPVGIAEFDSSIAVITTGILAFIFLFFLPRNGVESWVHLWVILIFVSVATLLMLMGGAKRDNTGLTVFLWIMAAFTAFLLPRSNNDIEEDKR